MPIVGRLVAVTFVLSVVAAAGASGQTHRPDQRRAYVGLNIGRLFEASEGVTGNATTWTVVIGYDFNNRWGLRSELGGAVEICDPGEYSTIGGVTRASCHSHGGLWGAHRFWS